MLPPPGRNQKARTPHELLPVSHATLWKILGPWEAALLRVYEAGIRSPHDEPAARSTRAPQSPGDASPQAASALALAPLGPEESRRELPTLALPTRLVATPLPPQPTVRRFSDAVLVAWLRWAATGLSPAQAQRLSPEAYEGLRSVVRTQARLQGRAIRVPCSSLLIRRLGGWTAAKRRAGLIAADCPSVDRPQRYEDSELLSVMQQAIAECGPELTMDRYRRWRWRRLRAARASDTRARIPSDAVLRVRLGRPESLAPRSRSVAEGAPGRPSGEGRRGRARATPGRGLASEPPRRCG